jgi:hypothetical protein
VRPVRAEGNRPDGLVDLLVAANGERRTGDLRNSVALNTVTETVRSLLFGTAINVPCGLNAGAPGAFPVASGEPDT